MSASESSDITDKYKASFCLDGASAFLPHVLVVCRKDDDMHAEIPMHLIFEHFVPDGFVFLLHNNFRGNSTGLPSLQTQSPMIKVGKYDVRPPGYFIPEPNWDFIEDPDFLKMVLNRCFINHLEHPNRAYLGFRSSCRLFVKGKHVGIVRNTEEYDKDDYDMVVKPGETLHQLFENLTKFETVIESQTLIHNKYKSMEFTQEYFMDFLFQYLDCIASPNPRTHLQNQRILQYLLDKVKTFRSRDLQLKMLFFQFDDQHSLSLSCQKAFLTDIAPTDYAW